MEAEPYTTNLSKAQGIVPETYELLELWEPGMSGAELVHRVKDTGALGKITRVRMQDLVMRGFARRYLLHGDQPAGWLRELLLRRAPRAVVKQLLFLFTARANPIFHDFVREVYWRKNLTATREVAKADARDFIEQAIGSGRVDPPWSDTMRERVARYLIGTLEDFELVESVQHNARRIRPPALLPETALFLAYELHFSGIGEQQLIAHPDWSLFGLTAPAVIAELEAAASRGHLLLQHSAAILRVEWHYRDMQAVIDAIAH